MRFFYSEDHINFLKDNFPKNSVGDLVRIFNAKFKLKKTIGQIRAALSNHNIKCGRKSGELKISSKIYTPEIHQFIELKYKAHTRVELAALVNEEFGVSFSVGQISSYCKRKKIPCGRTGQFEKGSTPWNTGTKGVMKSNSGSFKTGSQPVNLKEFGHERICPKDDYVLIKVDQINPYTGFRGRYVSKHRWLWEKANGPIPKNKIVNFKDGDKRNFSLENLELIDRGMLAQFNKRRLGNLPNEVQPAMRNLIKLEVTLSRVSK